MKKQIYISPAVDVITMNHTEALMTGSIDVKSNNLLQSDLDPDEGYSDIWGNIDEAE